MLKTTDIQARMLLSPVHGFSGILVADVETFGLDPKDGKLLGVALASIADPTKAHYVALQWYDFATSTWHINPEYSALVKWLTALFSESTLIGHNYAYDKQWLDYVTGIDTKWHACTRLMWHMASAPSGPRAYGLKDAQMEVLGWDSRGSDELEAQVKARGGSIRTGDHYLADRNVMAKYAGLDAASTALLYNALSPFFDKYEYWWMLEQMVKYSWLLQQCTNAGIKVNVPALEEQAAMLSDTRVAYSSHFHELMEPQINRLERQWREHKAANYTDTSAGKAAKASFLSSWERQDKFNLSSDRDKQELFYDELKLPVVVETEGKRPSTGLDSIKLAIAKSGRTDLEEVIEAYTQSEGSEAILSGFVKPWLGSIASGRLHPRFNPCGTVSYRLSGFKPYILNAPFDERQVMKCFTCDEGWGGVHADFASIEPCVTAHYSQDPYLLKVFRDGLGDVYLDLALTLFPDDMELRAGYDPMVPITSAVKERFGKARKVAKVIQLAVQYTGTGRTVQKNLSYAGIPMELGEAEALVEAYWKHFHRVKVMNEAFFLRFAKQGYLRNAVGRIIRVPTHLNIKRKDGSIWEKPLPRYKDLPNRLIQSSGHDILSFWVLHIARLIEERGITAKPVILDLHDSSSWQAPLDEVGALETVFRDALVLTNGEIRMTVPVKIEMKRFQTLAGLKGEE